MNISRELSDTELKEVLQNFYEYFENGYIFEDFLKHYLQKMGLEEVEVTKRSRDGGVDLTAIRKGVGDFSDADITKYNIQAKRNKPNSSISVDKIAQLRGHIKPGEKGLFITTSRFTRPATEDALNEKDKPVVLTDGEKLVSSCIDNGIGFYYKPIFSKRLMDEILEKEKSNKNIPANTDESKPDSNHLVEKTITANDIRARIISIPSSILGKVPADIKFISVVVNDIKAYTCSINRTRNYLGSVTEILKEYGLWNKEDGIINPKESKWVFDSDKMTIKLYI